ncbi:LOW QUALITY PROTEIN: venom protease-like [Penaeus monodon]|uniref:LOW QUALITY PROTEIN: venom protease-like n=1 Tax=Penaeus monodon TaxID=6687 RepID=UPI0018A6F6F5|nr:LOW QUALITY PROTEIN: venom protease-like [Penaeus monodon]
MSIGYRVLSLLVIVAGSTVTFSAAQGLGQDCTLLSGGPGVCRKITECPEVAQFAHRREVKYCGTRGRLAIVCCPLDSTSCPSTGNNDGIAAPVVNFECGRQATRTIPLFGPSRRRRQSLFGQSIGIGASVSTAAAVGGVTAKISAWPWMALLGELDSTKTPDWFCAGSLINDQWILTAAHCLDSRTPDIVRLGEHDYENPSETNHEDYGISQMVVYPHYIPEQAYHDLALIKLNKKVQIKDFIRPVCLPWNQRSPSHLLNSEVTVTGWGQTQSGGHRSSTLQEVQVKVFPSSTCHSQYKELAFFNRVWPSGIAGETMCAGTTAGGKDACQGDSGGPAVHLSCKRYTLAGVISKGFGCGLRDFAGLYVNVRQLFYLQWIKQTAF